MLFLILNSLSCGKTGKDGQRNYSEWCSANSYKGWLVHCNSFRLSQEDIDSIQSIANYSFSAMYITIMQGFPGAPNAAHVSGLTVALAFLIMVVCGALYYCCESANKRVCKNKNKVLLFHSAVKDVLHEKLERPI